MGATAAAIRDQRGNFIATAENAKVAKSLARNTWIECLLMRGFMCRADTDMNVFPRQ